MQDRAAASGHRVDHHHRRAHPHTGDFRLERTFIIAVKMADVGRCTAHVEADDLVVTCHAGGFDRANNTARWP